MQNQYITYNRVSHVQRMGTLCIDTLQMCKVLMQMHIHCTRQDLASNALLLQQWKGAQEVNTTCYQKAKVEKSSSELLQVLSVHCE